MYTSLKMRFVKLVITINIWSQIHVVDASTALILLKISIQTRTAIIIVTELCLLHDIVHPGIIPVVDCAISTLVVIRVASCCPA